MNRKLLLFLVILAFIFRIWLVFQAHHGDLNNNISWGNEAVSRGLVNYYDGKAWPFSAPNQPPLYILLFSLTSFVYKTVADISWDLNAKLAFFPSSFIWFWELKGMDLLVKTPAIIADFLIAVVLYKFFAKKGKKKIGEKISLLWLFNPVIWYNSALWGQTDATVNLLGLVAIVALLDKKLVKAGVFTVLSLLFKGSLAIFVPSIFAIALLQKYKFNTWLKACALSCLVVIAIAVWFHPAFDLPIYLYNLYTQKFFPGEIGSLTANTFNFWWLVDSGKTLDSAAYLGLSARVWGIITLLSVIAFSSFYLMKKISEKKVFTILVVISLTSFLFMTRIHERYLYPFFPYVTLLVGLNPIWLIPLVFLSLSNLVNLYHLFWVPPLPFLENALINSPLSYVLASINLIVFVAILVIWRRSKY